EVAAGTIYPNQARVMICGVLNPNWVCLIYDTVVEVNKDRNKVLLEKHEGTYYYLVITLGFTTNTFGIKGMEENAFFIQAIDTSQLIRDHIEYQFVKYKNSEEPDERNLTILVGGAGFTGIEFVGELAEKVPELCKKYDID